MFDDDDDDDSDAKKMYKNIFLPPKLEVPKVLFFNKNKEKKPKKRA